MFRHKHIWNEEDRAFHTGKHRFDGTVYEGPLTLITFKCSACIEYKQITLKGHIKKKEGVPEAFYQAFGESRKE